jgi:hypothetical protein
LRKKANLRLPEEKYAEIIVNEVARLEHFISDILLYSGEIPYQRHPCHGKGWESDFTDPIRSGNHSQNH